MAQEPRKATDVLLDIESKVGMLLEIIHAQDLNIKILSNKLNDVMKSLEKQSLTSPKVTIEAVNTANPILSPTQPIVSPTLAQLSLPENSDRHILIKAEHSLPQETAPNGFRRTSRPETFTNKAMPSQTQPEQQMQMPMQIPNMNRKGPPAGRGAAPDPIITAPPTAQKNAALPTESLPRAPVSGQIPIMQRCVDKNGKSVFLADVEIFQKDSMEQVFKTRTNGTGKWMATLGVGVYQVVIRKRISLSKEQMEAIQDIQVDGTQSPLELPMMIIK